MAFKRESALGFGATHAVATTEEALALITTRYTLDQVNQGYEDMMAGRNIRGVIIHA